MKVLGIGTSATVAALCLAATAAADNNPVVYAWGGVGDYTTVGIPFDPGFVKIVTADAGAGYDKTINPAVDPFQGTWTAEQVACHAVDDIAARLTSNPPTITGTTVCLLIQNFGMDGNPRHGIRHHPSDQFAPHDPNCYHHCCTDFRDSTCTVGCSGSCGRGQHGYCSPYPNEYCAEETKDFTDSPWTWNGRQNAKAWMQAFINEYRVKQYQYAHPAQGSAVDIPTPAMVQFDYETTDVIPLYWPNTPVLWKWIIRDDRWQSEGIPGFPGIHDGYKSLSELYSDAAPADFGYVYWGLPTPDAPTADPEDAFLETDNSLASTDGGTRFWLWAQRVIRTSYEGMFNEVAYDIIHASPAGTYPNYSGGFGATVQTGDHVLSAGTDGAERMVDFAGHTAFTTGSFDFNHSGSPWSYITSTGSPNADGKVACLNWILSWQSFADQLCPQLDGVPIDPPSSPAVYSWQLPGETYWASSLRIHRYQLESVLSSEGVPAYLHPVVSMVGSPTYLAPITRANMTNQFALCRSKATGYTIWNHPPASLYDAWLDEMAAYNDAYAVKVDGYSIVGTEVSTPGVSKLETSGGDPSDNAVVIRPYYQFGSIPLVSMDVTLSNVPSSTSQGIKFNIESGMLSTVISSGSNACGATSACSFSLSAKVKEVATGNWVNVSMVVETPDRHSYELANRWNHIELFSMSSTDGYVDGAGKLHLLLTWTFNQYYPPSQYSVLTWFDLVQGVLMPPPTGGGSDPNDTDPEDE